MRNKCLMTAMTIFILASCAIKNKAYVLKGNYMSYRIPKPLPLTKDSLFTFEVEKGFLSEVSVKEGYLIVSVVPDSARKLYPPVGTSVPRPSSLNPSVIESYKFYFPDPSITRKRFSYINHKPVLQAMSISLKIRPKLDSPEFLDSFPSQTQAGFNPALAIGYRVNYNVFKPTKDLFGNYVRQISITLGGFVGTGTAELSKTTTRSPVIVFPRTAPIFSTGGFLMLGYNNLHFGYSIGVDYAQGVNSSSWLYRGKLWHGITIGLDIIK